MAEEVIVAPEDKGEVEEHEENLKEAWKLLAACPNFYHDAEDGPNKYINMNDVWFWAFGFGIELKDENVVRLAELYDRYGSAGLLYSQVENGTFPHSEFEDNNRFIQFVQNEERIRKEVADSNKRAYFKAEYMVDGKIKQVKNFVKGSE